jgi:hypothetical protein
MKLIVILVRDVFSFASDLEFLCLIVIILFSISGRNFIIEFNDNRCVSLINFAFSFVVFDDRSEEAEMVELQVVDVVFCENNYTP